MAFINDNKFSKVIHQYRCDSKVFGNVREYLFNNYCLSKNVSVRRCLITITENSKNWFIPPRKDRYFDLIFTYWWIPEDVSFGRKTFLHLAYEGAEEIAMDEFKRRKETLPE